MEKDRLLEIFAQTGHFPTDTKHGGSGYVETQVKAFKWYEFLQIFAPIGLFALVLYSFYGQLPMSFLASISKQIKIARNTAIQAIEGPELQNRIIAQGTKMLTKNSAEVNRIVGLQKPARNSNGNRNGQLHKTKTIYTKPNVLPSPAAITSQIQPSRKDMVKASPALPTKGKKTVPLKAAIKIKPSATLDRQVTRQPAKLKSGPPFRADAKTLKIKP